MMKLHWRTRTISFQSGVVMGILNTTPDSFSDGGDFFDPQTAVAQAIAMAEAGASIIDIGGESTRPGSQPVNAETELARVVPVLESLQQLRQENNFSALLSIDTQKSVVARKALEAGADLVNDISGLRNPEMRAVCAEFGVPAVIMHLPTNPNTMRWSEASANFGDIVTTVRDELAQLAEQAIADGVPSVILDPGFGFGKSIEQNIALIKGLAEIKTLGHPVLLGASRKSTLGFITGINEAKQLDAASIAAHLYGLTHGADIVRVHDVSGHIQAFKIWQKLAATE